MPGPAQGDEAREILKAMSDYVTSQQTMSLTYDSDIEVITPELQKIQFTSSGQVPLSRPDKLRASRTGGYADVEFVFDGKTFTVHDPLGRQGLCADGGGRLDRPTGRTAEK